MPIFQHGGHLLKDFGSASAVLGELPPRIAYLLDVVMSDYDDDAAPVTSPIVGRVGQLTVVDTGNYANITSGVLNFTNVQTTYEDPRIYDAIGRSRVAGLATFFRWKRASISGAHGVGLSQDTNFQSSSTGAFIRPSAGGNLQINDGVSLGTATGPIPQSFIVNTLYDTIIVLRNIGGFYFNDNTLIWVGHTSAALTYYFGMTTGNLDGPDPSLSMARIASLAANAKYPVPELGTRDLDLSVPGTGTGTASITAPALNNTFVHTADTVIQFTITTLPTAPNLIKVTFRRQDGSNWWEFRTNAAGDVLLYEFVSSGYLSRGSSLAVLVNGSTVTIVATDTTIKIYSDGVLRVTYASATNFKTSVGGKIETLGASSVLANLTARTLDGIAQREVTSVIDYGGNGLDVTPSNVAFVGAQSKRAQFNGSSSYVNVLAALNALGFDPRESTLICRVKNNLWDTTLRNFIGIGINPAGYLQIRQSSTANRLEWYAHIGVVRAVTKSGVVTTDWMTLGLTTSSSADEAKAFYDGAQEGATLTGFGSTYTSMTAAGYGAGAGGVGNFWSGTGGDVIFAKGVATPAQMLTIHTALAAGTLTDATLAAIFPTGYVWYQQTERPWLSSGVTASSNYPGLGLATSVLPGPRAAGDAFTHEADCLWEVVVDAVPSVGNMHIYFRTQDADNSWYLRITSGGAAQLFERVAGVDTSRGFAAAGIIAGDRIVVVANGATIKTYHNTTLDLTYSSAANFATETSGSINTLGTGGRLRNLMAWPLKLASAALTPGAPIAEAAFAIMETERG